MLIVLAVFFFARCGTSRIFNTEDSASVVVEAGFDPSVSTQLTVIHYEAIRSLLLNTFDLPTSSASISELLDPNETIFEATVPSPVYMTNFLKVMAEACKEAPDSAGFFEDGITIDHIWKLFTGRDAGEDAKKLETDTLAQVSDQPDDVKKYALCFATASDPSTMYTNYVKMKNPPTVE